MSVFTLKFTPKLEKVRFLRRYKRFLADVQRGDGEVLTVHCPNTGRMTNCLVSGSPCWIFDSQNAKRKYRYGLELVTTSTGEIACVNTLRANQLVKEAFMGKNIPSFEKYDEILVEQVYGQEKSRIDFLLKTGAQSPVQPCFVEVKSVTLGESDGQMYFPDAPSLRAQKHLRELIWIHKQGHRAVVFFCVLHSGASSVAPAVDVDPIYSGLLREARQVGVELVAYGWDLSEKGFSLARPIEIQQ